MEHADGGNLNHASIPIEDLKRNLRSITFSMLGSIDSMMEAGKVHRDIKLENFVLKRVPDGRVEARLIDFDLATDTDDEVRLNSPTVVRAGYWSGTGNMEGTPPELYSRYGRDWGVVDYNIDVWGTAVALFSFLQLLMDEKNTWSSGSLVKFMFQQNLVAPIVRAGEWVKNRLHHLGEKFVQKEADGLGRSFPLILVIIQLLLEIDPEQRKENFTLIIELIKHGASDEEMMAALLNQPYVDLQDMVATLSSKQDRLQHQRDPKPAAVPVHRGDPHADAGCQCVMM